jgi:hypothetical protein
VIFVHERPKIDSGKIRKLFLIGGRMVMITGWRWVFIAVSLSLAACTSKEEGKMQSVKMDDQTRHALATVANSRIFFAHHSVGDDLIAGLRTLAREANVRIRFAELGVDPLPDKGPAFVHARPGRNGQPREKIDRFFAVLSENLAVLRPDIALMKLCYVDIRPDTDVEALSEYYQRRFLENRAVTESGLVMQVTTPLMAKPTDLKSRIFRLIGKPVWEDDANKQRKRYNEILTHRFAEYPLFDLAGAESTPLEGDPPDTLTEEGETYSLWPPYTRDGGHLSELGQRVIAQAFSSSLADALEKRKITQIPSIADMPIANATPSPQNSGKRANAATLDTRP